MEVELSPEERFKSLLTFAGKVALDHNIKISLYYKSGVNMYKEFNIHYNEGSWENALSIYLKYEKLFFHEIKKHPDYYKVPVNIKSVNASNFRIIKPKAEHAKKELLIQYQIDYDSLMEEFTVREDEEVDKISASSSTRHVQLSTPKLPFKKEHHDALSADITPAKVPSFDVKSQTSFNTLKKMVDRRLNQIKQAEEKQKVKKVGSKKSLTKSSANRQSGGYRISLVTSPRVSQKLSYMQIHT